MPPHNKRKRSSSSSAATTASQNPLTNEARIKNQSRYNKKMKMAEEREFGVSEETLRMRQKKKNKKMASRRHHQNQQNDNSEPAEQEGDSAMDFFSKVDPSFLKYMSTIDLGTPEIEQQQQKKKKSQKQKEKSKPGLKSFEDEVQFENHMENEEEEEYYSLPIKAPDGTWTRKAIEENLPEFNIRTKFDEEIERRQKLQQEAQEKIRAMESERYNQDDMMQTDGDVIEANEIQSDEDEDGMTRAEREEKYKEINKNKMKAIHRQYIEEMSDERKVQRELKMKRTIAKFSTQILTDPSQNIKLLNSLVELCTDPDVFVQKLALLSLCALFQDLAPSYRINLNQYNEEVRMSKQVEELRNFELYLLQSYQKYLQLLHSRTRSKTVAASIKHVALHCLCDLIQKLHQFNFAENIAEVLIELLNSKDEKVRSKAFKTVRIIFKEDISFELSAFIVESIAVYTKKKKYNVCVEMVACFLSLPLTNQLKDKFIPKDIATSKRKKGKKKFTLGVETQFQKDLREYVNKGAAVTSQLKYQTIILRNLVVTYVRLLKTDYKSPLLFTALEGISKFAHLLNVELIYDLLAYVRLLMQTLAEDIPINTLLQLLTTVSQLTRGLGETINIDMTNTFSQLYGCIMRVTTQQQEDEVSAKLLIQAIHTMTFETSSDVPNERAAALAKRLATCACSAQPQLALPMLFMVNSILTKFPRCRELLSADVFGMQQYRFDAENLDHANALSTNLWEFFPMLNSVHPHVARIVERMVDIHSKRYLTQEELKVLKDLSVEEYDNLIESYQFKGEFFPEPRQPKEDPGNLRFRKRSVYAIHKSSSFFKNYVPRVLSEDSKKHAKDSFTREVIDIVGEDKEVPAIDPSLQEALESAATSTATHTDQSGSKKRSFKKRRKNRRKRGKGSSR